MRILRLLRWLRRWLRDPSDPFLRPPTEAEAAAEKILRDEYNLDSEG